MQGFFLKRTILFLFLSACSLFAFQYDAKFYMGVGGGVQYEKFTDEKGTKNTPAFGALKFGYGDRRAYAVEFVLNYIDNKSNIFSDNDKQRYGADVMFVKAYNLSRYLYPFIRAGFGAGEMKVAPVNLGYTSTNNKKLAYSSFNIGTGAFFPLNNNTDIEVNYEYRFTSYQSYKDTNDIEQKRHSHVNQIYVGFNYRF